MIIFFNLYAFDIYENLLNISFVHKLFIYYFETNFYKIFIM